MIFTPLLPLLFVLLIVRPRPTVFYSTTAVVMLATSSQIISPPFHQVIDQESTPISHRKVLVVNMPMFRFKVMRIIALIENMEGCSLNNGHRIEN